MALPTIGALVHVVWTDGAHLVAFVTGLPASENTDPLPPGPPGRTRKTYRPDDINVCVLLDGDDRSNPTRWLEAVAYDGAGTEPNTWHWPE